MKTLQEIKDEVAEEAGHIQWKFLSDYGKDKFWPEVCRRACEESLNNAYDSITNAGIVNSSIAFSKGYGKDEFMANIV